MDMGVFRGIIDVVCCRDRNMRKVGLRVLLGARSYDLPAEYSVPYPGGTEESPSLTISGADHSCIVYRSWGY